MPPLSAVLPLLIYSLSRITIYSPRLPVASPSSTFGPRLHPAPCTSTCIPSSRFIPVAVSSTVPRYHSFSRALHYARVLVHRVLCVRTSLGVRIRVCADAHWPLRIAAVIIAGTAFLSHICYFCKRRYISYLIFASAFNITRDRVVYTRTCTRGKFTKNGFI